MIDAPARRSEESDEGWAGGRRRYLSALTDEPDVGGSVEPTNPADGGCLAPSNLWPRWS